MRDETRCRHMGYYFRLTAGVLLYAPSHRQDGTYHGLCYTSRGTLAGTRNSPTVRGFVITLTSVQNTTKRFGLKIFQMPIVSWLDKTVKQRKRRPARKCCRPTVNVKRLVFTDKKVFPYDVEFNCEKLLLGIC